MHRIRISCGPVTEHLCELGTQHISTSWDFIKRTRCGQIHSSTYQRSPPICAINITLLSRKTYDSLIDALRQGGGSTDAVHPNKPASASRDLQKPPPPTKHQEDYPNITYWRFETYTAEQARREKSGEHKGQRGRGRLEEGENVSFWFLQEETGEVIDTDELKEIRKSSKRLWRVLYDQGKLACPWKQVHPDVQDQFYAEIESKHPSLQLCHGNWKARKVCTTDFSHWYKKQANSSEPIKSEQSDLPEKGTVPAKRPSDSMDLEESNKRAKGELSLRHYTSI
jgi:hypothetical protein